MWKRKNIDSPIYQSKEAGIKTLVALDDQGGEFNVGDLTSQLMTSVLEPSQGQAG